MDPETQLDQLNDARARFHWAIANIAIALLCVVLAGTAFMYGHVATGGWYSWSVLRWW